MAEPYVIHFVSNTHWDREWLTNFQETRVMLVELLDGLLDLFEQAPEYRAYVLDSQCVPIEDYLEIRPENRARILEQVRAGRLEIGPWYSCPEGFSVNGESLVRNLLYGHRVGRSYGGVMKVGYTPFGYGQNSQMPQIYKGFGIDTMMFYHGVSHDEVANEFICEGADGTRILGSQMSHYARYNAYHHLYRGALYGDKIDDRSYLWIRGGLPFRLCRREPAHRQHLLLDVKKGFNIQMLHAGLSWLRAQEISVSTTRHLAFMMGHDSSVPDRLELRIIEEAKGCFPDDEVRHSSLSEMMAAITAEADWDALTVLKGERRTPKPMPVTMHLYSDVLSSRSRMKCLNTKAEYLLQRRAEPFAVLAAQVGEDYPAALLDRAWKTLLQCHAHDSIAGSGVDDIEQDMMYRLRQVVNLSECVLRTALGHLQRHIDNSEADEEDIFLTVFNASPQSRSEIVTAEVDLPYRGPSGEFGLVDTTSGGEVEVQVLDRRPHCAIINHAGDAPANLKAEQFTVHFDARHIPPMGYATFQVERGRRFARGSLVTAANTMENEFLCVGINRDGTLDVTHKETGVTYAGLNYYVDNGEAGHAWMHHNPAKDQAIDSRGFPVRIALEEDGPLLARYRVVCKMEIPAGLAENGGNSWQRLDGIGSAASRSSESCPLTIVSIVTLRQGAKAVEVATRFDNTARHHRLRVLFPTRREGTACHVESAFDVVERESVFPPESPWYGSKSVTFPQQRFVDVSDGAAGLAVINDGLREYEVTQDADRAIVLTLMRAFEVALCPVSKCWEELPAMGLSQSPGAHAFSYRIYPHAGNYAEGLVFTEAERLAVPLEVAQAGPHGGDLPQKHSFVEVKPANFVMTALKRAEEGTAWVLRCFNPTAKKITARITFSAPVKRAERVSLEEETEAVLDQVNQPLAFEVEPKKIVNLKVTFA